ncbi:MAG TPA: hypothetical protein VF621_09820 [Pyrinomonadaceae bacterium]|jgi:hypothetical protein
MKLRMCVGALALGFLVSLAALPVAAARLVDDIRALITIELRAVTIDPR